MTGGQYDVDVSIFNPQREEIYKQIKMQFDSHTFVAQQTGIYAICFSNEFSTFSHKLVYFDLQVGEEQPLPGIGEHVTVMTQVIFVKPLVLPFLKFVLLDGIVCSRNTQSFIKNTRFSNASPFEGNSRQEEGGRFK